MKINLSFPSTEWLNIFFSYLPLFVNFCLIYGLLVNINYIYIGLAVFYLIPTSDWLCRKFFNVDGFNEGPNMKPITKCHIFLYELVMLTIMLLFLPTIFCVGYSFKNEEYSLIQYIAIFNLLSVHVVVVHQILHEYIHRKNKILRFISRVGYAVTHFYGFGLEHLYLHHNYKYFLADEDFEHGRYKTNIYQFIYRSLTNCNIIVWKLETIRLEKLGKSRFSLRNKVIQMHIYENLSILIILLSFGWFAGLLTLAGIFYGTFIFWCFGYISHYALARQRDPKTGNLMAIDNTSAWDINEPVTKYYFLGGSRHPSHHQWPTKKLYEILKEPTAPCQAPWGYTLGFYLQAFWPRSYYKKMDKAIQNLPKRVSISKTNVYKDDVTGITIG